jgi:hypothetical protein
MSDHLLTAIANSSDRAWLKRCRDYNVEIGKMDVVQAADRRLRDLNLRAALKVVPKTHSVEERVFESLRVYRELLKHKHGRNQTAGYTERDIRNHGPREALIRTIRRGKKTEGLKLLPFGK